MEEIDSSLINDSRNTRFAKLDSPAGIYSALILAKAGVVRLGLSHRITADIIPPVLYHAVGQGALAVEIRSDDTETKELCKSLTHWRTAWTCRAERAMLRVLEGGCSVPVGVSTSIVPLNTESSGSDFTSKLNITGTVTSIDGSLHVAHSLSEVISSAEEAEAVGEQLARTLMNTGAKKILDDIIKDRSSKQAALSEKIVVEDDGQVHITASS